jgi:hypothetical protein
MRYVGVGQEGEGVGPQVVVEGGFDSGSWRWLECGGGGGGGGGGEEHGAGAGD